MLTEIHDDAGTKERVPGKPVSPHRSIKSLINLGEILRDDKPLSKADKLKQIRQVGLNCF